MTTRRSLLRSGARVLTGIVGLGVAAASIAAATWLPLPEIAHTPLSSTITPVPAAQTRVCPGPLLQLAADSADASKASPFGATSVTSKTSDGTITLTSLTDTDETSGQSFGGPSVLSIDTPADATIPPLIAGAQSQAAHQDELEGFAASACSEASRSSWLVAGATDLGQTSLVLLSNPSPVQATVNLTVYGESGPIDAPGAKGILVDPGTQRFIPLAGIAPNVKAPVVHVAAEGGSVLATMQQSVVRGLKPGGVELASETTPPSTHQVITGVTLAHVAAATTTGPEVPASTVPAIRVLVPGSTAATVRVGIVPEKGTKGGSSASATVQPGTVQEIPLEQLGKGNYTLTLDSSEPFVAAARTSTTSAAGEDFAWFSATPPLTGDTLVAVASGPGARVHISNPTNAEATLELSGAITQKITLPPGSAANVPAKTAGSITIAGASGLMASVSYGGDGVSAAYPVLPPGPLAEKITVYPK